MSRSANPFSPRVVLGMLVVGAAAFMLFLYAIGAGWTGDKQGGAHAASNGLDGYSALATLLERLDYDVSLSRNRGNLEDEALLILTPSLFTDGEDLSEIIERRRYAGPTVLVLPKWFTFPVPQSKDVKSEDGWVVLYQATDPEWVEDLEGIEDARSEIRKSKGFSGLSASGSLPDPDEVLTFDAPDFVPLVKTDEGWPLAGYWDDGGYYPVLAEAAGIAPRGEGDEDLWPVVIVAEPDLLNNYAMADIERADVAVGVIEVALEDYDLPVVFDLTLPGLGQSENLLTLAFTPPFLAATLCLVLAALVIAWRAFLRFGPPRVDAPLHARGKAELARNGASLVERARRIHLLGAPYAAMVSRRIARRLGLRQNNSSQREDAIAQVLAARGSGADAFTKALADLRQARTPGELLRAAGALSRIERTLKT